MKKILFILFAGLIMNSSFSNQPRMILSSLRGGDYLHAGDKEAIDLVLSKILEISPCIRSGRALDVGSGLGGTCHDWYQEGFQEVWGIDVDANAVAYAKKRYPSVHFFVEDALCIDERFPHSFFSFISLFNVFYAIPEKKELLQRLFQIAKPGGVLVLFDYTTHEIQDHLIDLSGNPIYPMQIEKIEQDLLSSGWNIIEVRDLSAQFVAWYRKILDKLDQEQEVLLQKFSLQDTEKVRSTISSILFQIEEMNLGGAVIYAQKI